MNSAYKYRIYIVCFLKIYKIDNWFHWSYLITGNRKRILVIRKVNTLFSLKALFLIHSTSPFSKTSKAKEKQRPYYQHISVYIKHKTEHHPFIPLLDAQLREIPPRFMSAGFRSPSITFPYLIELCLNLHYLELFSLIIMCMISKHKHTHTCPPHTLALRDWDTPEEPGNMCYTLSNMYIYIFSRLICR